MHITWRDDKARRNKRKHGLDFTSAAAVFADPLAITLWDQFVGGEERWRTIGAIVSGRAFRIVVVVHTYPDGDEVDWVQVISMRDATRHERRAYETQIRFP